MKKRQELFEGMFILQKGMQLITLTWEQTTGSDERSEEWDRACGNVLDGNTPEGYAHDRYFFDASFDDETYSFGNFVEDFKDHFELDDDEIRDEIYSLPRPNNSVVALMQGFDLAIEGIGRVVDVCEQYPELKEELKGFEAENARQNPFKNYGISQWERKFRGWRRAVFKELKDEIGRRKYDTCKKQVVSVA